MLGDQFVSTYAAIKRAEFETFMEVISPGARVPAAERVRGSRVDDLHFHTNVDSTLMWSILVNAQELRKWLAAHGCTFEPKRSGSGL